ncbi:MAG: ankyrin repeat protein [Saprospiraceae bacterium]|jgi:ankyrin repeat protein
MTSDDFFGKLGDFIDKSTQNIKDRLTFDVTDLIRAIDKNDTDQVERVLRAGVDPNKRDGLYRLALPIATDNNIAEIVGMLLKAGANPSLRDQNGDTALYKAVYWENDAIIELLLKKGADINQPNGQGVSPLQEAQRLGRADMIALLEGYKDDKKTQKIEEDKKTHADLKVKAEAARKRREEAAEKEREMEAANKAKAEETANQELEKVYGVDGEGYLRPLLKAMQSKDSEAVKTFIEKVEDLNAFDVFYNSTPLMMAIQLQNTKLSMFLTEKGADGLSFVPTLKHSPFTKAVSHNMYELVALIIEKNQAVIKDYINNPEQLLSTQFLSYKDARMMDVLLSAGADPNFGGKEATSPIVKAIEKAGLGILPVLAKNKVDLNFKTEGKSLLEWAIFYNRTDWVTGLLAEGADPKLSNGAGKNALEYAESLEDRTAIIAIIREEIG